MEDLVPTNSGPLQEGAAAQSTHLLLVTLLVVELGLEAECFALIFGQLVWLARLLLAFALEVVQAEAMAAHTQKQSAPHRAAGQVLPQAMKCALAAQTASGVPLPCKVDVVALRHG